MKEAWNERPLRSRSYKVAGTTGRRMCLGSDIPYASVGKININVFSSLGSFLEGVLVEWPPLLFARSKASCFFRRWVFLLSRFFLRHSLLDLLRLTCCLYPFMALRLGPSSSPESVCSPGSACVAPPRFSSSSRCSMVKSLTLSIWIDPSVQARNVCAHYVAENV